MNDMVNHPAHYTSHPSGVECIEIAEHHSFCAGNALKYIWRAGLKGDALVDLRKARWYLDREIARLERQGAGREAGPPAEVRPDAGGDGMLADLKARAARQMQATVERDAPAFKVEAPAPEEKAPPKRRTGPYSDLEISQVGRMLDDGRSKEEIAAALDRDPRAIHVAIARAKKDGAAPDTGTPAITPAGGSSRPGEGRAGGPGVTPTPSRSREQTSPKVAGSEGPGGRGVAAAPPAAIADRAGKSGSRRTVARHLDALPASDSWPAERDLRLAEMIVAGEGIANAALELQIPSDDCKARWGELTAPIRGEKGLSLDGQAALMEELRERAAAHD